jgi:hypothetical protein
VLSAGGQHKVARLPVGKIDRREKSLCWGTGHLDVGSRATAVTGGPVDDEAFHDVPASRDANVV